MTGCLLFLAPVPVFADTGRDIRVAGGPLLRLLMNSHSRAAVKQCGLVPNQV
jgi:hypothetical protein